MQSMNEYTVELSPEAREQLQQAFEKATRAAQALVDAFIEIAQIVMDRVRRIAIYFGRLFFKMQLLEWRISPRLAELVSEKIYWYWAVKFGFAWFNRKFLLE